MPRDSLKEGNVPEGDGPAALVEVEDVGDGRAHQELERRHANSTCRHGHVSGESKNAAALYAPKILVAV